MAGKLYKRDINAIMELVGKVRAPHKGDIERAKIAAMTCKTAKEFAAFLEIEEMVFKLWCNEYPSYRKAVLTWRDHISSKVEVAMAKRAIGFKEAIRKDVITKTGQVETLIQETYYPPDTAAGQFWLKNRSPEDWKDKSEVDINVQANIRAWLIAAGEEVPEAIEGTHKILEGSNELIENSCSVGMTEGSELLIEANNIEPLNVIENDTEPLKVSEPLNISTIDETLNTTDHTPLNITPAVIEQEPVAKVQNNDPNWSLFNDE